jgi:hypothetical protein
VGRTTILPTSTSGRLLDCEGDRSRDRLGRHRDDISPLLQLGRSPQARSYARIHA